MTPDEMATAAAYLPATVHLVGGPYCGYFFHPHHGCIHDVHGALADTWFEVGEIGESCQPARWQPGEHATLRITGVLGEAWYEQWSDEHWFIVTH